METLKTFQVILMHRSHFENTNLGIIFTSKWWTIAIAFILTIISNCQFTLSLLVHKKPTVFSDESTCIFLILYLCSSLLWPWYRTFCVPLLMFILLHFAYLHSVNLLHIIHKFGKHAFYLYLRHRPKFHNRQPKANGGRMCFTNVIIPSRLNLSQKYTVIIWIL